MPSKKDVNKDKSSPPKKRVRRRSPARELSAMEKCKAVLAVWSERRNPTDVCRELSVNWATLHQWQSRALEGMLQALEPRVKLTDGPALSPRLQTLLEKNRQQYQDEQFATTSQNLGDRLTRIQESRENRQEQKKKDG